MTKIGNKEHFPLENLDLNSNREKRQECFLHDLIGIALKSGRLIFFGISYSVLPSEKGPAPDFVVKFHPRHQAFLRLLHICFSLFLFIPFVTETITMSPCCLVNFIKKGLHIVLIFCMIVGYYCLEVKGRRIDGGMAAIFRQCTLIQNKFNAVGLHFPTRKRIVTFGWTVAIGTFIMCIGRQVIFLHPTNYRFWYDVYARMFTRTISFGFWVPSNDTSEAVYMGLGIFGLVTHTLIFNYSTFLQIFLMAFAATVWAIFDKLNGGMKSGFFAPGQIPEVVDLHFQSTKLLKLINNLVAPLTFWSIVLDIIGMCFWTNFIAIDLTIRLIYLSAVGSFLKTALCLLLIADVNSKAHEVSEWLEECCASSEKLPMVDLMKFTVFTKQIYSKETSGFRGLRFFVVTSHLIVAVSGIIVTYTVAVNQLCHNKNVRA